jgi:hypothetical protein
MHCCFYMPTEISSSTDKIIDDYARRNPRKINPVGDNCAKLHKLVDVKKNHLALIYWH